MLQEAAAGLPARERELVATSLIGVEQLTETVHEFLDLTRIEAGRTASQPRARAPSDVCWLTWSDTPRRRPTAQGIVVQARRHARSPQRRRRSAPASRRVRQPAVERAQVHADRRNDHRDWRQVRRQRAVDGGCGTVVIRVTDTGPGVPAAFRTRIFDKFFRLEHQHLEDRHHPRGAGIGLYMCRQIVELHGGHITCAAGADDRGACMTVELPVSSPAAHCGVSETGDLRKERGKLVPRICVITAACVVIGAAARLTARDVGPGSAAVAVPQRRRRDRV